MRHVDPVAMAGMAKNEAMSKKAKIVEQGAAPMVWAAISKE
jgi:hypothetical protein